MNDVINIHEAKTHLSRLVEQVAAGEELIIGKAGKPMARLIPYKEEQKPRLAGALIGQVVESDDCWEADEAALDGADEWLEESMQVAEEKSAYDSAKDC